MYVVDVINDVDASGQPSVARYLARVTSKHVYENKGKMCAYNNQTWQAVLRHDRPTHPPTTTDSIAGAAAPLKKESSFCSAVLEYIPPLV